MTSNRAAEAGFELAKCMVNGRDDIFMELLEN
jgi:hypothetical protein